MIRIFHNEQPGADRRAIETVAHRVHHHTCPVCKQRRECTEPWCRRMEEGYIECGIAYQPVNLLCDECAGIKEPFRLPRVDSSIEIRTEKVKKEHGRHKHV